MDTVPVPILIFGLADVLVAHHTIYTKKKKKRVFSTEEGGERESEARNRVFLCVSLLGYFGLLLEHQSSRLSVLARVHCIANKTICLAILIDIFFSLFSL